MKNKISQKDRVLKRLRETGQISRNECLKNYISRLSAIMLDLKNDGINFETKNVEGDYVYFLKDKPRFIERMEIKNSKGVVERVIERPVW